MFEVRDKGSCHLIDMVAHFKARVHQLQRQHAVHDASSVYLQPADLSWGQIGHNMSNSLLETHVSEMQLWFVTVSSNELDHCALWDTTRWSGAVHDTNGLASYLIKSNDDTDGTLIDFEWRLKITYEYINCPV